MNSEISNVSKLSPVTVVKAEKSDEERLASTTQKHENLSIKQSTEQLIVQSEADSLLGGVKSDDAKKAAKPTAELVQKAAEKGNELLQSVNRSLQFKVDDSTKELVVKIVDNESGEIVRQIPSEQMLDFIKRMQELEGAQGSVLQDRA